MKSLAIIPARGGSKRIPKKNIKTFFGKPIISFAIESAINSNLFDSVMVSTDCKETAEIAKKYGASVPFFRSKENSTDNASTLDVIKEVLQYYKSTEIKPEYVCCIYPCNPLLRISDLHKGFNLLKENRYSSVIPITEFSYPIWRGLVKKNEKIEMIWAEHKDSRTQDLDKVYHDAGQWYWFKPELVSDSLFTNNTGAVILKSSEVQDIDTEEDWKLAEIKYNALISME